MFGEKWGYEISAALDLTGVDQSNILETTGVYCICQWLDLYLGERPITKDTVQSCIANTKFQELMSIIELQPMKYSVEGLVRFCAIIKQLGLQGWYANAFFYHYLPCIIADTKLFDETNETAKNGPVSSTLVYFVMKYSGEALGTHKIFELQDYDIYLAHQKVFDSLGISNDDFFRYWECIHFCATPELLPANQKIQSVRRAYRKMDVPASVLLTHYAMARQFPSKELRKQANPWQYIQKSLNRTPLERGVSADEDLFNHGAYQISLYDPTDVVHTLFYKGRDDSRMECSLALNEYKRVYAGTNNTLIVNPSPIFLAQCCEYEQELKEGDQGYYEKKLTIAVADETVRAVYKSQYPNHQFVLISEIQYQLIPNYDHIIAFGRDYENQEDIWKAIDFCAENAFVTMLLPQTVLTQNGDSFLAELEKNSVFINWIMDVPSAVCQSKPRKKMFLTCRKGSQYQNQTMRLFFTSSDNDGKYIVPEKKFYSVPVELMARKMTLIQMRTWAMQRVKGYTPPVPRAELRFRFSKEIKLSYILIVEDDVVRGRAYYRRIHRADEKTRRKGKRPDTKRSTEKGLRGKTKTDVISKLKSVVFYDEIRPDIVEDIHDYYKGNYDKLTLKTIWFYCHDDLSVRTAYQDDIVWGLFCGQDQTLSDLVVGTCSPDDIVRALEAMYGEDGADKKRCLQLHLLFQVAAERGLTERNPMASFVHVTREKNKERAYMLNAATKKICFTDKEESRMVDFLREAIALPGCSEQYPRYVAESKWLVGAFALFAGLQVGEICPLLWGDLRRIDGAEGELQLQITKRLNNSGDVISNVSYRSKEKYRMVSIDTILGGMLLERKAFLMKHYGYSEKELEKQPIILEEEPAGYRRKRLTRISRRKALDVNKALLEVAQIEEDIISVLEGENRFDVNLNSYSNDLFSANFRHKAYHLCGFTEGELSYHVGNKSGDTFSRHYCDYSNDFLQYDMVHKLYRWTYRYDKENTAHEHRWITGVLETAYEFHTERYAEGKVKCEVGLMASNDTKGSVRVEIDCRHGLTGEAVCFHREEG